MFLSRHHYRIGTDPFVRTISRVEATRPPARPRAPRLCPLGAGAAFPGQCPGSPRTAEPRIPSSPEPGSRALRDKQAEAFKPFDPRVKALRSGTRTSGKEGTRRRHNTLLRRQNKRVARRDSPTAPPPGGGSPAAEPGLRGATGPSTWTLLATGDAGSAPRPAPERSTPRRAAARPRDGPGARPGGGRAAGGPRPRFVLGAAAAAAVRRRARRGR